MDRLVRKETSLNKECQRGKMAGNLKNRLLMKWTIGKILNKNKNIRVEGRGVRVHTTDVFYIHKVEDVEFTALWQFA